MLPELMGKTVLIMGYRGDNLIRYGRIVDVRDTEEKLISLRTMQDNVMTRGRYLIKVWDEARDTTRSYYIAHCGEVHTLGVAGRIWHWLLCALGIRVVLC